jgi:hypothetical protein
MLQRTAKSCGPGAPTQALRSLVSMSPTTDGGNQAMVTEESTYKRVPWKGTVLERVQVPSGKGRSGR